MHKQSGQKGKRVFFFLSLGAILLLLLPFAIGSVASWRSDWDGVGRLTLVWEKLSPESGSGNSIGVFSIDPSAGTAVYVRVPESVLLDVPYGYKTYLASSVFRLGELDPKRNGGVLLAKSIEATMGVAVDGYVVSQDAQFPPPAETVEDLVKVKQTYFTLPGLVLHLLPYMFDSQVHTDISLATWYRIWNALRELRTDQVRFFDLEQSQALQDQEFPDGTVGEAVQIDGFDLFIGTHLQDMRIRSQEVSIEVVNATGQERLASKFGTILERLGGRVIAKTTAKELQKDSCLYYIVDPQVRSTYIISYLQQRRECREGTNTEIIPTHSDILVVLGEEFIQ